MVLIFDKLSRKSRYLKNKKSSLFFSTPFSVVFCRRALCIACIYARLRPRVFGTQTARIKWRLARSDWVELKRILSLTKPGEEIDMGGGGVGGGGRPPPPQCPNKKRGGERERKKENKVACMHVKLPSFNHFQSKIKYKSVLYEENTGHMHQIAPLTTSKCKKLPHPPPSLALLPRTLFFTAPLKFNPGYATAYMIKLTRSRWNSYMYTLEE